MPVTVTSDGSRTTRKLRGMAQRAENVSLVWPRVGNYMSRVARRQFTTSGRYLGSSFPRSPQMISGKGGLGRPWRPLNPVYAKRKVAEGYTNKPLIKSGQLMAEFVGRPMNIERYGPQSAVFGSGSDLAGWMHYGTRRHGKRVVPPRPIIYVTPSIERDVASVIAKHILGRGSTANIEP